MLPHGLAAELQTRPNRQLSLFEVTLDSNMGGEARKKKTNGEWKMWYTRRGGENGEWRMENGTSTAQLSHGAALANAFATANLRSGFPSDLRPRLRRERGKKRVVRRTAKPIEPTSDFPTSDLRTLSLRPNAPMPRVFFCDAFSSRGNKNRNRSTAASYGDGAKGAKRMCPKRVGLFLKDTLKTLGFLGSKNACAPRGAHGCAGYSDFQSRLR
jgi:hypothetical protein